MSYIKADNDREQVYFDYLEDLRKSGDTNMWLAGQYLQSAFGLGKELARKVLCKWMKFHDDPRRRITKPITKTRTEVRFVTKAEVSVVERKP